MNKFVLLLGVIVLVTLAIMFFCVGFFTGSNISTSDIVSIIPKEAIDKTKEQKIIAKNIGEITDAKSFTISDKILSILNAAGCATKGFSDIVQNNKASSRRIEKNKIQNNNVTIDSLLREIAATHHVNDDCSYEKTKHIINNTYPITDRNLFGKKIVFIGYFKNDIAAQIQELLVTKGYKVHVERSKSWDTDESFVFCGPFEKEKNASRLVEWLRKHDFGDARVIDIVKKVRENALFDTIKDNSDNMPINEEIIPIYQNDIEVGHPGTVNNENTQHINHGDDFGNQNANINISNGQNTHIISDVNYQTAHGFPREHINSSIQNTGHTEGIMMNPQNPTPAIEQQVNHNPNYMLNDQSYGAPIPMGAQSAQQIMTHPENVDMPVHGNISVPHM